MDTHARWSTIVVFSALLLGILVSTPQLLHMLDGRYQGIAIHLNADEFSYLPRVQDALHGRSDRLGVAVTGGEEILPTMQSALIERVYGRLFGWTGWNAATLLNVMDFVIPFFLFLVLYGFCRACGLSQKRALIAAVLFSLLEFYNLGRPIHQRASFLLVLLTLWLLIEGLERNVVWGLLGGVLLGMLIDVYFWSWTAAWAWLAVLFVFQFAQWTHARHSKKPSLFRAFFSFVPHLFSRMLRKKKTAPVPLSQPQRTLLFACIGLFFGAPFLVRMSALSDHPLYTEVFFRSGIGSSHMPESWIWSGLFAVMAGSMFALFSRTETKRHLYIAVTVITAMLLLNQHVLHGVRFLFASHYLFFLVLSAVLTVVSLWGKWSQKIAIVTVLASCVFLSGIAYDNRSVIAQWRTDDSDFSYQHLASALDTLMMIDSSVVLSDPLTSSLIASYTHHDVLFTHYIQHEMRSHQDLANRYCLTQLFADPYDRHPEEEHVLVYGAAYDAIYNDTEKAEMRKEELALVQYACAVMDRDPLPLLQYYNVTHVLWDEKRNPAWQISRHNIPMTLVYVGEGWSLWRLDI